MSSCIRIGVVGLGMGRNHAKAFHSHPGAELVALCDSNKQKAEILAAELNVPKVFSDAVDMFENAGLDAVSIAVPNKFHAQLTIAALERGLHVLCEKPMAMNTSEAELMKSVSEREKRNLMINFSFRFNSVSNCLKSQVELGNVGDIYFGRTVWHRRRGIPGMGGWFCDKELAGGGPLIDLCVHRLDLALWLMGFPEPITVSGATYNRLAGKIAKKEGKKYTVEDLACGMIRFDNGATLIVEASWALNIGEPEHMVTMLAGTKGGIVQKNIDGAYGMTAEIYTEEDGHLFTKKIDDPAKPVPSSYHEFINSIIENRPPAATAEQGIKVMKILDALYASAETGMEINFNEKYADIQSV